MSEENDDERICPECGKVSETKKVVEDGRGNKYEVWILDCDDSCPLQQEAKAALGIINKAITPTRRSE